MWQRFTIADIRVIGHYLGVLILFCSCTLLVPLVTAVIFQEWIPASHYLFTIGIFLIVGSLLRFSRISPGRLDRQQAMIVTALGWITLSFLCAIPLYLSGHFDSYLDALFDGVSGLTTTGISIINDLDHLSNADNMWRFVMHFLGGIGLVVVALSFGLFGKRSSASLYVSEGRSEHVVPNIVETTRFIAKIAIGVIFIATCVLSVICLLIGMEPSRAILQSFWLAVSGFVTGGFTPMSQSVMYYHSVSMEIFLMVLMILGSINFALYLEVWRGRLGVFYRDLEVRTMALWVAIVTCVFAVTLSMSIDFSELSAILRRGVFLVISAFSTTGFQNITSNQLVVAFSSGAFLIVAMLMAVGGSGGSTSGGIKFSRMGIIAKSITATIKETLAPDSARVVVDYNHLGRRVLSSEEVKGAMTIFILYVVTYALGALVGIAHGYDATAAIFEAVSMASNGGLTSGISSQGMPTTLQMFYIFLMWAGRLEFMTLLAFVVKIAVSLNPRRIFK